MSLRSLDFRWQVSLEDLIREQKVIFISRKISLTELGVRTGGRKTNLGASECFA